MRASHEMTDGLNKLKSILAEFPPDSAHWNEAQNRFQFVDRLLVECLGWQQPDLKPEDPDESGGRSDYLLGINPTRAVLEAKREAKLFDGMPFQKAAHVRKIEPLTLASKNFKEAVVQVIPYCAFKGAPIGIVCNGPQLAIFQAITQGFPPLEGECFFFDGYETYVKEFPLLWKLLSPEGIEQNIAYRDLSFHRNPRIPPKASQFIPEPNKYRYRSDLEEELRSLSSMLLEEIEDNPDLKADFYRECYVPIEANNRHLLLSKQVISSRYKRVGDDGIVPPSLDSATKIGKLGGQFTSGAGSRPIVVIGEVGVGKTSFFENLYQNIGTAEKNDTYYLHIDLGKSANLSASIKDFVLDAVPSILRKTYDVDIFEANFVETIYHEELRSFERSPEGRLRESDPTGYQRARLDFLRAKMGRPDGHLRAALAHLAHGRKRRIILVLDNADQRTFEVQQDTFLIAQELAATRMLYVFVSLRPSTFYLSKMQGPLSAYQNKILTISPPPADVVIEKRISFALRVAGGQVAPAAMENIKLNLGSIVCFLTATLRSVRQNDAIRQFLSNITGGNTRAVIEMITSFCGSPNVDARKIVDIESEYHNYIVPLHEFTKHALLGDFAYFNSQSSFVAFNVFDVRSADPREHFLASLIISYLSSNSCPRDNDGFVSGRDIAAEMSRVGFIEEQVSSALRLTSVKRLIETPYLHYREIKVDDAEDPLQFHYRATSIGIYHVRFWTGSFAFLDAVSTDTPIFEEGPRTDVTRVAASFDIADRFKRASAFKRYLEQQWHNAAVQCSYYNFVTLLDAGSDTFEAVERVLHAKRQVRPLTHKRAPFWRGRA